MKSRFLLLAIMLGISFSVSAQINTFTPNAFIDYDYYGWVNVYNAADDTIPQVCVRNNEKTEDLLLLELKERKGKRFLVNITDAEGRYVFQHVYIDNQHISILLQYGEARLYSKPCYTQSEVLVTIVDEGLSSVTRSQSPSSERLLTIIDAKQYKVSVSDIKGDWLKVGFTDKDGALWEGWLPPVYQLANPY